MLSCRAGIAKAHFTILADKADLFQHVLTLVQRKKLSFSFLTAAYPNSPISRYLRWLSKWSSSSNCVSQISPH
jgi:hypothetical protein